MIKIANKIIGAPASCFVIAEAGVNHNGIIQLAKKLVDAAVRAGADAVKFQIFKADDLVVPDAPKARYQNTADKSSNQYQMLKKLELSQQEFRQVFNYCRKKKIIFLATPFDSSAAAFLNDLGVAAFKISSGDMDNIPLLLQVARYNKPLIISTGMSDLNDVQDAVEAVYSTGNKKVILLHCTSDYPAKYREVNLRAIEALKNKFNLLVGYSDHTSGFEVAIAAVARGCCVLEKHFTLNKCLPGPDHRASLEPGEFKEMVRAIRNVETALGSGVKKITKSEAAVKKTARKSIVADVFIPKGKSIQPQMLVIKRPGIGISARHLGRVVGRIAKRSITKNELIKFKDLK